MRTPVLLTGALFVLLWAVSARAADLAPTGTLRAAFLATNPVQARTDPRTGEVTGPVADVTRELARRLGVPHTLIPAPDARTVIEHLRQGTADVGFLAFEEQRAQEVDYAGAFAVMFNTFLVPAASPLRHVGDVDRSGVRVGAVRGQTPQIHLSANLKQARVEMFDTTPNQAELERLLTGGALDAFGLNAQRAVEAVAASRSALRALEGSFLDVDQSFVVGKGEPEKVEALRRLLDELRESGFLAAAIERAKLTGVGVPRAAGR